jgi:hypothetical protein
VLETRFKEKSTLDEKGDATLKIRDDKIGAAHKALKTASEESSPDTNKVRELKWKLAAYLDVNGAKKKLDEANKKEDSSRKLDAMQSAKDELEAALSGMYKAEEAISDKPSDETARQNWVSAKTDWIAAREALGRAQTADSSTQLSIQGLEKLKASINNRIVGLDNEIEKLEKRLAGNSIVKNDLPDMIVGVVRNKEKTVTKEKPDVGDQVTVEDPADVWTNVAFTVNSKTDDHKQEEFGLSGGFNVEAQRRLTSVRADSPFSENGRKVNDFMASSEISVSFSVIVVNIKRPWLHAELFQDFDIDVPTGSFLSPGARIVKSWVETGNDEFEGKLRTNYRKFPAYPTAFIVAADTHLTLKSKEFAAEEALCVLKTDSSVKVNVGCWAVDSGVGVCAS